jgi:triosephosphate isomerase
MERVEITASTESIMASKVQDAREHGWMPLSCQGRHVAGEHAGMLVTVAIR